MKPIVKKLAYVKGIVHSKRKESVSLEEMKKAIRKKVSKKE